MNRGLCNVQTARLTQSFVAACRARMVHNRNHTESKKEGNSKLPDSTEEDQSKPLKFSTSKGSHRHWNVDKSLGSEQQQSLRKVLPITLTLTAILLWAIFRKETEIDEVLYRPISELLEEMEKDKTEPEKGK